MVSGEREDGQAVCEIVEVEEGEYSAVMVQS